MLHSRLLLVMAVSMLMNVLVSADSLYPICKNQNVSRKVVTSKSADTILDITTPCNRLEIRCLAYNVSSFHTNPDDTKTDHCAIQGRSMYDYDIHVEAYNLTGASQPYTYNIRDNIGSSVAGMNIFSSFPAGHRVVFTNQASSPDCVLETHLAMDYICHNETQKVYLPPVLVGVKPATLFDSASVYSYVSLQHPPTRDRNSSLADLVTVVDHIAQCGDASASRSLTYVADPPEGTISNDSIMNNIFVYSYMFTSSGMFRLCYHANEDVNVSLEIAMLTVYGSNPAYYTIYGDNSSNGEIIVHVPTVIKFWGSSLDTRTGGDSAKFVSDESNCDGGALAGGVPLATNLQPADTFGPMATYALWNFTMQQIGAFKVCYRTSATGRWAEVPFVKDIGRGSANADDVPSNIVPTPIDPDTGKACAMAPANDEANPWVNYHGIELVLTTSKLPNNFFTMMTKLLCIPRSSIALAWLNHTESKNQAVYFTINCEEVRSGDHLYCSSMERYNYLVSLFPGQKDFLQRMGIQSVQGIKTAMALDADTNLVHNKADLSTVLIISILFFSGVVLLYVSVNRYVKSRQAYIQFGTDDVDIDDMYSADETLDENYVPADGHSGKNTLIEIED